MFKNNDNDMPDIYKDNNCVDLACEQNLSQESINQSYINKMNFFAKKRINLYKTEMCRSFEETGCCKYGDRCQFAHHVREIRRIDRHPRYKTETCRTFWEEGTCPYGKRCCFIHLERGEIEPDIDKDIAMNPIGMTESSDSSPKKAICVLDSQKGYSNTLVSTNKLQSSNTAEKIDVTDIDIPKLLQLEPPIWDLKSIWETNEASIWCLQSEAFCYIKYRKYRPRAHKTSPLSPGGPVMYRSNIMQYQNDLNKLGL